MNRKSLGFTIVEAMVAIGIFAVIASGVLGLFAMLNRATKAAREQTILSALSASRLEIMRNLPYDDVGTAAGNPPGVLPDFTNPAVFTYEGVDYQVYYEATYIDDPADGTIVAGTDVAPNDYKQVNMYINNTVTNKITQFISNVSPKGLEGISNAGALVLKVFDAAGQPVPNATLTIVNNSVAPAINLSRSTDAAGNWIEVGLPTSVNGYQITASKNGYSTDSTYPITVANPNPVKPHATVNNGVVTQVSFAIDLISNLTVRTVDTSCVGLGNIGVNIAGSKLIGTAPDVYKYNVDHVSSGGAINLNGIEWDVYYPTLRAGQPVMLYGTSPIQQVNVLPGANQIFTLVLGPVTANALLVIVKDASTGLPIEGASVQLASVSPLFDETKITGGSVWNQMDWSGGSGQADYALTDRYFADSGSVDTSSGSVQLALIGANYMASGDLTSSTFNTGGSSNYTILDWLPTSQNPNTTLSFQVATNNDNLTWNFLGPDGTAATYYTVPGTSLNAVHNGSQYVRYKAYLSTNDTTYTPALSNVSVNYVSGCNTPGQVIFPGLSSGNNYAIDVSMAGYSNYTANNLNISGRQTLEILLSP